MMGFDLSVGEWLLASLLGAVVGLDSASWPQAMWSRPLAAGTAGGLLFGAPAEGFLIGAWLELVMSRHPPFGAARYPETGPAALTAGAAYGLGGGGPVIGIVAAVLVGWTIGWVGMHSVTTLRRLNERLVAAADVLAEPGELARRHRLAMRLDGARAGILVAALLVPSALFVRLWQGVEPGGLGSWLSPTLAVVGLAGLAGSGARALGTRRRRWPAFAGGGLLGALVAWGLS